MGYQDVAIRARTQADPANAHLTFIRLRTGADAAALTGRSGRD